MVYPVYGQAAPAPPTLRLPGTNAQLRQGAPGAGVEAAEDTGEVFILDTRALLNSSSSRSASMHDLQQAGTMASHGPPPESIPLPHGMAHHGPSPGFVPLPRAMGHRAGSHEQHGGQHHVHGIPGGGGGSGGTDAAATEQLRALVGIGPGLVKSIGGTHGQGGHESAFPPPPPPASALLPPSLHNQRQPATSSSFPPPPPGLHHAPCGDSLNSEVGTMSLFPRPPPLPPAHLPAAPRLSMAPEPAPAKLSTQWPDPAHALLPDGGGSGTGGTGGGDQSAQLKMMLGIGFQ